MKYILTILISLNFFMAFSQVPEAFHFQGIAYDQNNQALSHQEISVQISLQTESGVKLYTENHFINTNLNGMFVLAVGRGSVVSGSFSSISWGDQSVFINTSIDESGGTEFKALGLTQLLAVPYALYAKAATNNTVGSNGPTGLEGAQGASGVKGEIGAQGLAGIKGEPGDQGEVGPKGDDGLQVGITGPKGDQGPIGEDGKDGLDGQDGQDGKNGLNGKDGKDGLAGGVKGDVGIQGEIGPKGDQGPSNGIPGPVGTKCWDLNANGLKDPNEDIDNNNIVDYNDCRGIKGEKGLKGPPGPKGPPGGEQGEDGADGVDGADGPTGPQGPTGNPGKDYWTPKGDSISLDNGYLVGIGIVSPACKLDVAGDICSNGIKLSSDVRFKKSIQNLPIDSDFIQQINAKQYHFKTKEFPERNFSNKRQYGFLAQEVEEVYPHLVFTAKDGFKAIDYMQLVPLLWETNLGLKQEMEDLNLRIVQLEQLATKTDFK